MHIITPILIPSPPTPMLLVVVVYRNRKTKEVQCAQSRDGATQRIE